MQEIESAVPLVPPSPVVSTDSAQVIPCPISLFLDIGLEICEDECGSACLNISGADYEATVEKASCLHSLKG